MRLTNAINEMFARYKIEKWNEKTETWEYYCNSISFSEIKLKFDFICHNNYGIFRLIKLYKIKEIREKQD